MATLKPRLAEDTEHEITIGPQLEEGSDDEPAISYKALQLKMNSRPDIEESTHSLSVSSIDSDEEGSLQVPGSGEPAFQEDSLLDLSLVEEDNIDQDNMPFTLKQNSDEDTEVEDAPVSRGQVRPSTDSENPTPKVTPEKRPRKLQRHRSVSPTYHETPGNPDTAVSDDEVVSVVKKKKKKTRKKVMSPGSSGRRTLSPSAKLKIARNFDAKRKVRSKSKSVRVTSSTKKTVKSRTKSKTRTLSPAKRKVRSDVTRRSASPVKRALSPSKTRSKASRRSTSPVKRAVSPGKVRKARSKRPASPVKSVVKSASNESVSSSASRSRSKKRVVANGVKKKKKVKKKKAPAGLKWKEEKEYEPSNSMQPPKRTTTKRKKVKSTVPKLHRRASSSIIRSPSAKKRSFTPKPRGRGANSSIRSKSAKPRDRRLARSKSMAGRKKTPSRSPEEKDLITEIFDADERARKRSQSRPRSSTDSKPRKTKNAFAFSLEDAASKALKLLKKTQPNSSNTGSPRESIASDVSNSSRSKKFSKTKSELKSTQAWLERRMKSLHKSRKGKKLDLSTVSSSGYGKSKQPKPTGPRRPNTQAIEKVLIRPKFDGVDKYTEDDDDESDWDLSESDSTDESNPDPIKIDDGRPDTDFEYKKAPEDLFSDTDHDASDGEHLGRARRSSDIMPLGRIVHRVMSSDSLANPPPDLSKVLRGMEDSDEDDSSSD